MVQRKSEKPKKVKLIDKLTNVLNQMFLDMKDSLKFCMICKHWKEDCKCKNGTKKKREAQETEDKP